MFPNLRAIWVKLSHHPFKIFNSLDRVITSKVPKLRAIWINLSHQPFKIFNSLDRVITF